ncbi:MAG TPA: DMT family transporter [Methanomassiliicoccales archaeon]|nr:DMT family transporter [Methanomassiliicoccales archaeon]
MPEGPGLTERRGVQLTLLASLLLGSSYVAIKSGVSEIDPLLLCAMTVSVGALVVLAYCAWKKTLTWRIFLTRETWLAWLITFVLLGLQYGGLSRTNASTGALIIGSNVLIVAPLSAFLFRERLTRRKIIGLAVGLGGLFVLTTKLDVGGMTGGALLGDVMLLGATICIALTYVLSKYAFKKMTYEQFVLSTLLFTPLPLFALYLGFGSPTTVAASALPLLLYIGVMCTAIPTLLWVRALEAISITTSSTIILSESSFAVILSILLLHEPLDVFIGVGAAMVFSAIYLVSSNGARDRT